MPLDDHLFRRESGRLVACLTRIFGVHNLSLAEDVAQEAFCRALEVWPLRGVPENPQAWLMATAKNRALDVIRRQRTAAGHASELEWTLRSEWTHEPDLEVLFLPGALKDDLLRMMFACCDPRLPEQTQVPLILQILCGFSVSEIAAAFVRPWRNDLRAPKRRWRRPNTCSISLFLLRSFGGFLPSSGRSTCFSTRATTEPQQKRQYEATSARKRCG
jgi:predicted RNA polymerase sigma factor